MEAVKNKIQSNVLPEQDLGSFLNRVNKPDASQDDVARLKKMLAEKPIMASICGNIADSTHAKMIEEISQVPLVIESTKAYVKQLKDELGWQDSAMLERLLIETIVSCWLQYHQATTQMIYGTSRNHSIEAGTYLNKRVSLAHKRFLKSIEALAKVRKLNKTTPVSSIPVYDPVAYSNPRNTIME